MNQAESDIYRKLQQHLDTLPIGYPATESGVEIRILKFLFSPEEAEIALNMRFIPEPIKNIYRRVKKFGINLEQLEELLEIMFIKGAIRRVALRIENGTDVILYQNSPLAVGMFEYQVTRITKEFFEDFEQYMEEAFRDEFTSTKINQLRTIPVEKSISPNHNVANYDELRNIFEDAKEIAVSPCICHKGNQLLNKSCNSMSERCFTVNGSALNAVNRGYGHLITKDEAFSIIEQAQGEGLVIQPGNSKQPSYICCCCSCCDLLTNLKKIDRPWELITSNYYAEVDSDLCIGCETCIERCIMDAIQITDNVAIIEELLCIGCGNCVVTCPEKAINLQQKETESIPPETTQDLFLNIMSKRAELRRKDKGIE
ncbi:MAG: 4Fe-4S binding protein [Candidatus Lokiarchaeota archaeon]|nr:4Fe-4S binding protein [Candidatus Lokiarchaeota archaeon]